MAVLRVQREVIDFHGARYGHDALIAELNEIGQIVVQGVRMPLQASLCEKTLRADAGGSSRARPSAWGYTADPLQRLNALGNVVLLGRFIENDRDDVLR